MIQQSPVRLLYTHSAQSLYTIHASTAGFLWAQRNFFWRGDISTKHRKFCVLLFLTGACYCSIPLEASSTYHGRASKRSHRLRFRCWLFITYLHLTIEPSPALSFCFCLLLLLGQMSASTRSFSFSFHIKILAQGFSRRKKKMMRFCVQVFPFWIDWLPARQHIYIYPSALLLLLLCAVVTVLLFFLLSSCYAGVNLIYVPHTRRCCYTTGVFSFLLLNFSFLFAGRAMVIAQVVVVYSRFWIRPGIAFRNGQGPTSL